jgi:hypothetical protein
MEQLAKDVADLCDGDTYQDKIDGAKEAINLILKSVIKLSAKKGDTLFYDPSKIEEVYMDEIEKYGIRCMPVHCNGMSIFDALTILANPQSVEDK